MSQMEGQLLRFRVVNHRSLRDEQELSLVASPSAKDDPRLLHPPGIDEAVLPVCALYGANASGKSNVLKALSHMRMTVEASQRLWGPTEDIPREPFALSAAAPSTFVVDLVLAGVRYEYGFSLDSKVVREEWLRAWPNGRKQEWFSRDEQRFEFSRSLRGENKAIEALTRPNSLFLSAAAQNNHQQLLPLYEWFTSRVQFDDMKPQPGQPSAWWKQFAAEHENKQSERLRAQVQTLLRTADLGVEDFRILDELPDDPYAERMITRPGAYGRRAHDALPRRRQLTLAHRSGELHVWLDLSEESTGTQALIGLLPRLLPILEGGGLLVVDEINSLHPMLTLALIQLFQDPARNPRGAQLLCNTHDASLLGNLLADPPPLRRDQIWLTEKDRDGATRLYPLTDYTPRAAENLERGYLQGRYGAVPFLGSFDWSTPANGDE